MKTLKDVIELIAKVFKRLQACVELALIFGPPFIRWFALVWPSFFVVSLACLIAPILPAFAVGKETLPRWLRWFQTPDNTLDGDKNFIENIAPFPGRQSGTRQYINRVCWLWRNPSYGFDIDVLGFVAKERAYTIMVGSLPENSSPRTGWYLKIVWNQDDTMAFQFYAVKRWGTWASRVNFGWKLWSLPGRCQFVVTVQPYLSIPTH